jgi:hypothetical protein
MKKDAHDGSADARRTTEEADSTRGFVARGFTWVEAIVDVGRGALLALSAVFAVRPSTRERSP